MSDYTIKTHAGEYMFSTDDHSKAVQIMNALDKQSEKAPDGKYCSICDYDISKFINVANIYWEEYSMYCPSCGQKIMWVDKNDSDE